jgi:uncharacterized protein YeeX (DUF496 family)
VNGPSNLEKLKNRKEYREKWLKKWSEYLYSIDKTPIKKISYSQVYNWSKCPHLHWLISVSKQIPYSSNTYSVFGYAIHESLEYQLLLKVLEKDLDFNKIRQYYMERLRNKVDRNIEDVDLTLMKELNKKVKILHENLDNFLTEKYGVYSIVSIEEDIKGKVPYKSDRWDYRFIGYVDLIIQDENGVYHMIDFKTSKSSWTRYQRQDKSKYYQLILYKYFWLQNKSIPVKDVKVSYVFLKRNGKVSSFDPTSGKKRMENSVELMKKMIWNAYEREFYIKKKGDCKFCGCEEFYKR